LNKIYSFYHIDRNTEEKIKLYVFVVTFHAVNCLMQKRPCRWICVHNYTYTYLGGTTQIIVSCNLKASLTKLKPQDLILKLANGLNIHHAHNFILKESTGSGKIFLGSAFDISVCHQLYKVNCICLIELLNKLSQANLSADDSYRRSIKNIQK